MPRVALIIEHKEVAVFDYGLNRLEMKCVTNIPNYTIKGNFLFGDYDIFSQREVKLSSVIVLQCDKQSCLAYRFWIKPNWPPQLEYPQPLPF